MAEKLIKLFDGSEFSAQFRLILYFDVWPERGTNQHGRQLGSKFEQINISTFTEEVVKNGLLNAWSMVLRF